MNDSPPIMDHGNHPSKPAADVELIVLDVAGEPVHLTARVHLGTVELHSAAHCCAVFARATLRDWLHHPNQPLTVEGATWKATRDHGVVLDIPMLFVSHPLSVKDLEALSAVL